MQFDYCFGPKKNIVVIDFFNAYFYCVDYVILIWIYAMWYNSKTCIILVYLVYNDDFVPTSLFSPFIVLSSNCVIF
jgi:hypothetical protein